MDEMDDLARVLAKRTRRTASGCLEWMGARAKAGYGEIQRRRLFGPQPETTHRIAWRLAYGAIPDGQWVLHRCDNPACCEPTHLFLGTHQDNVTDKMQKGRHRHGHLYGDDHPMRKRPELVKRGEAHNMAKLTLAQVQQIRALQAAGGSDTKIAKQFGVSRPAISAIRHGRAWRGQ